jgi:hypothetical protein
MNKPSKPKDAPQVAVPASDALRRPVSDTIDRPVADLAQAPIGKQVIPEQDALRISESAAKAGTVDAQQGTPS